MLNMEIELQGRAKHGGGSSIQCVINKELSLSRTPTCGQYGWECGMMQYDQGFTPWYKKKTKHACITQLQPR